MPGWGMAASLSRELPAQREEPPVVKVRTSDILSQNQRRSPLGHLVPLSNDCIDLTLTIKKFIVITQI